MNRSGKDKIHKNTPYKSQFLDFLVINSHVKSNHHDEHGRYLWFNRQHYFLSLQKPPSCPPFGYCNRTNVPATTWRMLRTAFAIVITAGIFWNEVFIVVIVP
jgi:hypothetical protein